MDRQVRELDASGFQLAKHNGIVTVENPRRGKRQTFQVTTLLSGSLAGTLAVWSGCRHQRADVRDVVVVW
jgi:hypothetical protein